MDDDVVFEDPGVALVRSAARRPGDARLQEAIDLGELCAVCEQSLEGCALHEVCANLGVRQIAHRWCYNGALAFSRIVSKLAEINP